MGGFFWLMAATASAQTFPFTLSAELEAADWLAATEATGFALAPAATGPGGELRTAGSQAELIVRDLDGQIHRVVVPLPTDSRSREAVLVLAANLIRPARFTAPPVTPTHPPPPPPPPPRPVLRPIEADPLWMITHTADLIVLLGVQPMSLLTPQSIEPPPVRGHRVRLGASLIGRSAADPGAELSLAWRTGRPVWLGASGSYTRAQVAPEWSIASQLQDGALLGGLGWQGTRSIAPELGLWGGPMVRNVVGECYMCDLSAEEILTEQAAIADGDADEFTFWSLDHQTGWLFVVQAELAVHVPIGKTAWDVVPYARARWESPGTIIPGYYGYSYLSQWHGAAGVAVERNLGDFF